MLFGLFWLLSCSFKCFSCRSSKMTPFPLYFLLLFILFPSVLSLFCLFLFSRFFSPFSPLLHFVGLLMISVFLHVKLCAKKGIFLNFCKTLFFCLLFSIKISVVPVSFFCWASLRHIFFHVLFFCLLKNGFSLCLTLLFFDSSCKLCFFFLLSFFLMYPRIKKVVF